MQFAIASLLALAGSALAQWDPTPGFNPLTKPLMNEVIPAGTKYTIEWTPAGATGPVSLLLVGGVDAGHLATLATIGSAIDATLTKFDWDVDASLGTHAAYGIKIVLDSNTTTFQWSNPFTIKGSGGSGSGSTTTGGSTSTTSGYPTTSKTSTTVKPTTSAPTTILTTTTWAPSGNLSTSATRAPTGSTNLPTTTGNSTTTGGQTTPTSGAMSIGVGAMALAGGVAMAVLGM